MEEAAQRLGKFDKYPAPDQIEEDAGHSGRTVRAVADSD
jgi:hypothetical protein